MGIREKISGNNAIGYSVAAALIIFGAGYFYLQVKPPKLPNPTGAYYTDDDGKTYFSDTIYKFPPFDHDGKQAVMACVFSCSKGNFVGFVVRYTPQTQKKLQDLYDKVQAGQEQMITFSRLIGSRQIQIDGAEVKMPGDNHWIPRNQMPYPPVKAPDGGEFAIVQP